MADPRRQAWAPAALSPVLLPLACLAAAIVATWPLARSFADAVLQGTELNGTPTLHGLWSLWWVAERAGAGFTGLWDAPIFHPQAGSFTFSEPMLLIGAAAAPLWRLGLPPALCYNAALLGVLTLNGVAAGRLARALGAAPAAALAGALLATALPVVAKLAGVLTVLAFFGLLLSIEGAVRFGAGGSRGAAALSALGFVIQGLTSQQLALLGLPALLAALLATLAERRFSGAALRRLALAWVPAVALVLLILAPALRLHRTLGFARSAAEVARGSARPADFLTRPASAVVSFPCRETLRRDPSGLFPGALLLALAAIGTVAGLRGARRAAVAALLGAAAAEALLALGPNLRVAGLEPYGLLRAALPGIDEVRSPFRAAIVAQAILAVLAALGVDGLLRGGGRGRRAACLGIAALAAAENLCVPAALLAVPRSPATPWTAWLREQPPGTVVAHLPLPAGSSPEDLEVETWRMYRQIDHRRPVLNGYSGFFPPLYNGLERLTNGEFPSYRSVCALAREAGVTTLVLDRGWRPPGGPLYGDSRLRGLLEPAWQDGQVEIYRITLPPGECVPAGPGAATDPPGR